MMGELAGKVAIVTGGSRGIGRAVALRLGQAGASVVISARGADELQGVVEALLRDGIETAGCAADVGDNAACERLVAFAAECYGGVDVLVNNAGIGSFGSAEQDMRARALREQQVEAERLLVAIDSALQADPELLDADERAHIDTLLADVSRVTTMADFVGFYGCSVTSGAYPPLSGPYGTFATGTTFSVVEGDHDNIQADTARGAVTLITVSGVPKLTVAENQGAGGGTVWYWNGNLGGDDWTRPGTAQSIFLNLLHDAADCAPAAFAGRRRGSQPGGNVLSNIGLPGSLRYT